MNVRQHTLRFAAVGHLHNMFLSSHFTHDSASGARWRGRGLALTLIAATLALGALLLWRTGPGLPARDATFDLFWRSFSSAVVSDDDDRVKAQTLAPLMSGRLRYDQHDVASVTEALFGPAMRTCLQNTTPERTDDGRYMLVCEPFVLMFANVEGRGWRFSEFGLYE